MTMRCTAEQLPKVLALWHLDGGTPLLCEEKEDAYDLKPLDLLVSTIEVFVAAFEDKFKSAFDKHKQFLLSKQNFIDYLKPRCLMLAQNGGCFDLVLICAFVSHAICTLAEKECFHFARVACKLLNSVLEDEFPDRFNTDSGWKELMSYCRKIHDAVLPSKKNRPPGHRLTSEESEAKRDMSKETVDGNEPASEEESSESRHQEEGAECSGGSCYASIEQNINALIKRTSSLAVEDPLDADSLDDNSAYWDYETLNYWTICQRITYSQKHLKDTVNLLTVFEQKLNPYSFASKEYDLPISDDEDIERLERNLTKPDFSNMTVQLSNGTVVDYLAYMVCKSRNREPGDSWENEARFEDVTDEERFRYLAAYNEGELRCPLCYGRKRAFYIHWFEDFRKTYGILDTVSDHF